MLNRTVLVGRMTKDVDLRYTQAGKAVGNFTVAVNRPFTNQQTGEKDADFINCTAWGKQAENLAQYMKKGSQVGVDGRLQTRSYENSQGQTVFVTEVIADSVQFLEPKKQQFGNTEQSAVDTYNKEWQKAAEPIDIKSEDLPF